MVRWQDIESRDPAFADDVKRAFGAYKHKVLATIKPDGSPRVSGVEATFNGGELWLGMMGQSRKTHDLLRDPRMALHSATCDKSMTHGDAKISGEAHEVVDPESWKLVVPDANPPPDSHLFRVEISSVVLTRIGDPADHLDIDLWTVENALRRMERA